jgi:hypothetical protein
MKRLLQRASVQLWVKKHFRSNDMEVPGRADNDYSSTYFEVGRVTDDILVKVQINLASGRLAEIRRKQRADIR